MRPCYLLTAALLLPGSAQAAPPKPGFANLPAYLQALNQSADPEAKAIRARIASGPADLIKERTLAEKAGLATRLSQLVQPLPPPDQNAALLYLQLDALRKQKPIHFPPYAQSLQGRTAYTPAQMAAVQKEYEARPDIFSLLHQAADKPLCVFAYNPARPFDFPPEYQKMRENARELTTESLLIAYQGKYSEAAANQERGFHMAAHLRSAPNLIGFLVASAIESITVDSLQSILQKAGPNAALDSRVSADILALPPVPLSHALSGDPADADKIFDMLREAKPAELAQFAPDGSRFFGGRPAPAKARLSPAEQSQWNALIDAAEADYLRRMRPIIAAADQPSATRQAVFEQAKARAKANHFDPIAALSDQLNTVVAIDASWENMPETYTLNTQANQVAARRLAAAAGASVLATKAQTGAFPASLPSPFVDPFTNKPLGYRLEGANGFVVYSAGPGGTFDGGKPGDKWDSKQIKFRYPLVPVRVP